MGARVAWITGAGRGIGRAIALSLSEQGIATALIARTQEEIEEVARTVADGGGRAEAFPCDLGRLEEIRVVAGRIREGFGAADILVNNAGLAFSKKAAETSMDDWQAAIRINLTAPFFLCKEVIPEMARRRWGRIVNIASTAGKTGYRYTAAYTASKHGLVGLTRALALEVAGLGITVNAVCPGWVNTPMTDESVRNIAEKTGKSEEDARAILAEMNPQKRLLEPEEVAAVVSRLVGEEAKEINGQAIDVNDDADPT